MDSNKFKMSWSYEWNRHTQTKINPEKKNGKVVEFLRREAGLDTSCVIFKERSSPTENIVITRTENLDTFLRHIEIFFTILS